MKINRISGKSFENLGTIFAYKRRKFYPTIPEIQPTIKDIKDIIEEATVKKGEELIYIPSSQVSELSEQALYNFEFNVTEDKKYIPNFYPGILDNYSQEILDSDLDIVSPYIVPQISPSDEKIKFSYFGGFQDADGNIIKLLKVPAGIWKLEIYNESRITSNIFYESENKIIEYNISSNFIPDIEPDYIPCIEIYLGPLYNTKLEGLNYENAMKNLVYKSRYLYNSDSSIETDLEKCYDEYENSMSETDYVKNYYQEVLSEKIICIAYSSNKEVISINLVDSSFNNLKNPWRNQNKISMRTDDYLSHNFSPLENEFNFVFDKSSGVILGTERQEFPIFEYLKSNYSPSLRSSNLKEIKLDNKIYINGNRERLFSNPIISPDWILKRDLQTGYKNCYITSEEGGMQYFKNSNNPIGGQILFREGDIIKIRQECQKGYEFEGIGTEPSVHYYLQGGYYYFGEIPERIIFKYSKKVYKFMIKFSCEKDYDYIRGKTSTVFDSRNTEELVQSDISIKILNSSGIFEDYSYNDLDIIENKDIVLKIIIGDDSKYEFKNQLENPITVNIPDQVEIADDNKTYIFPVELKTFQPEININSEGEVDLESRRIICDYGDDVEINFFSEDPKFTTEETALEYISIFGKYKELEYISNESNYYTLKLSGVISKMTYIEIT